MKENLNSGSGLSFALEAVAQMVEVILRSEPVIGAIGKAIDSPDIAELIRKIPSLVEQYQDFNNIMNM